MVVLTALECSFKLGNVLSKLMLDDQITIEQQLNGIVQCSPAHPVILVLHENIKRFNIEVSSPGIYLIKNSISLGGFPVTFLLKIFSDDLLYSDLCIIT